MTGRPRISAVLGLWLDRPPLEALDTAAIADELGYPELWIGEMATFDAFALGAAVARRTQRIHLTLGPFAAAVRTPVGLAMGAATVGAVADRPTHLAIGSSSAHVVEAWHGRSAAAPAQQLAATASGLRPLLDGDRGPGGFRLRVDAPASLTIAAFGDRAVEVAAAHADRMVINLVTVEAAAKLREKLDKAAAALGRATPPRLAAWVCASVDPDEECRAQLARALVPYLGARGYDVMFERAGFADAVAFARRPGIHPKDVLAAIPAEVVDAVGIVGDAEGARRRIAEYAAAGVDEVCIVAATAGDPGGVRTLTALAPETSTKEST